MQTYLEFNEVERQLDANGDAIGLASKIFNNEDFGYFKVTVERPDRRKAQFSAERIAPLRFDKSLSEAMEYCYGEYNDKVYQAGFLAEQGKHITDWCEKTT